MKIGERRQSYRRERWRRRQASKRRLALHRHLVQLLLVGDYLEIKISKKQNIFLFLLPAPSGRTRQARTVEKHIAAYLKPLDRR